MKAALYFIAGFIMMLMGTFAAMLATAHFTMPGMNEPLASTIAVDGPAWYWIALFSAALPSSIAATALFFKGGDAEREA